MRKFTSIHWVMALFIAAISLCSVLPGQHVRASEFSPVGEGSLFAAAEENGSYSFFAPPTGLIPTVSGESEVRFLYDDEESIYYRRVYEGNESSIYSHYEVEGTPSSACKVRVQLKDQTQANDVRFGTDNNENLPLTDGGFWFPAEEISQLDRFFSFDFEIFSSKAVEVDYTVSLYQSEDLTTKPMASSEKKVIFMAEEDYPVMPSFSRLRGELNTDVPYTFSIKPGILQGKAAILRLSFNNVDMNNLVVSGEGWQPTGYWNRYEYRIDHMTQDEITVNFTATGQIEGTYYMTLFDGEGNPVVEEQNIGELRFPASLSNDDQQALKAMQEANPESTELRNFIETGLYKKDIDRYGTTEKVAVKWNDEASARVSDFYLRDEDRKVFTLNLNALKGLKSVDLDGTNLKTLDLSGLTLSSLDLINTPLKWSDVKLPNWTDEYHSLSGYTTIQLNPTVIKGAEIDLSEFAQEGASTFSWFEYNRSEGPKPVELTQTSPGKFILDGENGQRFYCEIQNERYENWIMRTSNLICAASGEAVVQFESEPNPIDYQRVYSGGESSSYSYYTVESIPPSAFKVRVQLKDQTQANDVRFETENNENLPLTDGGFWFPTDEINQEDEHFYFNFRIASSKAVEVDYTVSLYRSEDLTTKPMASSERKVVFVAEEDYPVIPLLPSLRGELNTDVSYTFSIKPGFLQGKPVIVRLSFDNVDLDNLVVSGKGWQKNEYFNRYEYRIDRLTQDEITVNFKAIRPIGGSYEMDLYDGEDNSVMGTGNAVLQFPANLSNDDQQALKAMQEANPESKELRNFIETGRYKKDINIHETSEQVAVKWNEETPARVIHFLLRDDDRKVTTLNLNALNSLKTVELRGTNLKTLDLSGLTPVNLGLHDTPLKWSDVELPNWTDEYHSLNGCTTIQLNNPLIKKGEEIDLSEFAQVDGIPSTFSWFESNRSEEYAKPVELKQTSLGKFILDGENGQRFYCEIQNERYGNWRLRTSNLICTASGEPVVRFDSEPDPIDYQRVYEGRESSSYSHYRVESIPPSACKVRVQLKDQTQANDVRFETDNNNSLTLTDGGFWFPAEEINQKDEYLYFDFRIASSKAVEVDYTVSLYQSEDLTTEPRASTEKKVIFVAEEDYPVMPSLPSLRRELNTDVPYTFLIKPGFLQGKPAIVRLVFNNVDMDNLDVSGEGWQQTKYWNRYEYRIDRLTQDKITVNFKATGQIGGRYRMALCDGEGNDVQGTSFSVLQFPANLSENDQQVLEAMQKANPESKELRDFIETGRYKKDSGETTEKVAVTWNYETPSRVNYFYLIDEDRKVSTLNLNALKGLETVRLGGTNLKTLDLSGLTLEALILHDTPLKWSDVKLPKWTEYNHRLEGHTMIQLDSTIMKGAEIDLSEFVQVDGTTSTYSWFECDGSDKQVKLASPAPGKFILNGEKGQQFYCVIQNERYGNWVLVTTVVTVDAPVIHFSQQDVKVLEKLVKDANDPKLNEWWESKAWQGLGMINGAQTEWNDENPRRLKSLWILYAGLSETVDLSTLDRLETLCLMGNNNSKLTKLILPTEKASLSLLSVAGNAKLTSLDVTSYTNLNYLDVSGTGLEACDVSKNTKLKVLNMRGTNIPGLEATALEIAKQLETYGVPNGNVTIDLDIFPALKKLIPNEHMRYSDVKHPRQMESSGYDLVNRISLPGDAYNTDFSSYGHTMDISEWITQDGVTSEPIWGVHNPITGETDTLHIGKTYTIGDELKPGMQVYAEVHNDLFPGWTLRYSTIVYTMDGDVNLDRAVDVKDVTSLISFMLNEWPSDRKFGWTQANTNHDESYGDAADLVGLVNIILGKPVTKGEALRAAYIPQAELSVDERNNLYIDHEAPISALYLEFAGATKELALTGDAARMTQSRSLQNDTLRIVAYSMDGKSIATGKQALMQLAPGMQLTKASFSDAKAVPLKLVGNYLPTANETIAPFDEVKAVYNYPNPASGTTTFCYSLSEDANSVEIELIASNGAVVARLQGLPTTQGRHEENVSLPFGNGVYFYRLVLNGKQIVATNTLIIK